MLRHFVFLAYDGFWTGHFERYRPRVASAATSRKFPMNNLELLESVRKLASSKPGVTSLLAEVVGLLRRHRPHYHWVGFYLLEGEELVLGPYVGKPTSHTRIPLKQGICGAAASTGQTLIVDDVNADPRYLA